MKVEEQIHLNRFRPREYQLPIFDAIENKGYKKVLCILPRRAGKDMCAFNIVVRYAIKNVCVCYYILPTYSQGRKIIFDSITNTGERVIDYIPKSLISSINSQEMKIRLTNGSLIQVVGSDNYDSLVGTNPKFVVFSEYALQDERAYQYIRPILAANGGIALFLSTPRGKNHLWTLYQIANESPSWFCYKMTLDDTRHIAYSEIEKDRKEGLMSEDLIMQEYYCFPDDQEVMCDTGLKPISEVRADDLVVSHSGRIRRVIGKIERDYNGDLIEFFTYGSYESLKCTENHPIRVYDKSSQVYTWKEAKDITIKDRLVFPKISLGKIPVISRDLCMLLAWYICEGSSCNNAVQFTLGKTEERERVSVILGNLGLDHKIYPSKSGTSANICVHSTQLVDFFKSTCGLYSQTKRIPFNLISSYEDDFFHELMLGDGCYSVHDGYKKYSFTTTSKSLAYQVQLLANSLSRNYAAGITYRKASRNLFPHAKEYDCAESYSVQIGMKGENPKDSFLSRTKFGIAAQIKSIQRIHYEGIVHNLKVQYDESYLVGGRSVHNCSFEMGVEGAYYARYIDKMRIKNQIGIVPWEAGFKVHTAWDIGVRDSTCIIFFQNIGTTVRIIDCYERNKEGLEHYINVILSKPYTYGRHIAPHDMRVKEFGSGMTRVEKARQLGINFTIAPNIGIEDGIESVRSALSKIWIDESSCRGLIKALENYRQEFDSKRKVYKSQPLHDSNSHFADCMRYLCVSLPKTRDGLSAEELEQRYQDAFLGPNSRMPSVFRDDLPPY